MALCTSGRATFTATVLATVALSMLFGCYRQLVSEPSLRGSEEWTRDRSGIFRGPLVEMEIRSSNETARSWFQNPTGHSFGISVQFRPLVPGLKFDPREARITLLEVGTVVPARIEAIADGSFKTGVHLWNCWSNRRLPIEGKPPYLLSVGSCFELYFSIPPPSPETPFRLHLNGITRDGATIDVPEFHFQKGSFWVFDFLGR